MKHTKTTRRNTKTRRPLNQSFSQTVNQQPQHSGHHDTNIFAILSLIFGILFFIPLAAILAVVFGFIALNQIKHTQEDGRGMAIAGIILGFFWLLIWIICILFFIAMFAAVLTSMPLQ